MLIDIENYLKILKKSKITQSQFLLLYCIYIKKYTLLIEYLTMFPADDNYLIGRFWINDLINRNFLKIADTVKDNKITLIDYVVGDEFKKYFIVDDTLIYQQVYDIYPEFTSTKEGVRLPLLTGDFEELTKLYAKHIDKMVLEHEEILKDVLYMKENNMLNIGIEKFIKGKMWNQGRKERTAQTTTLNKRHIFK